MIVFTVNTVTHAYGHMSGPFTRPTVWARCGRTGTAVPVDNHGSPDMLTCPECVAIRYRENRVPVVTGKDCRYCRRYGRPCGRHES